MVFGHLKSYTRAILEVGTRSDVLIWLIRSPVYHCTRKNYLEGARRASLLSVRGSYQLGTVSLHGVGRCHDGGAGRLITKNVDFSEGSQKS